MVFSREGIVYNRANPALYASNYVQTAHSVSLKRDRIRRNATGRQVTPANSWVCRVGDEYHLLPRGRKKGNSSENNAFELSNTEVFVRGDKLTLLEPHTTLNAFELNSGDEVSVTIESRTDSFNIDGDAGIEYRQQVVNFINASPVLSSQVYALPSSGTNIIHLFAKGQNSYTVEATGVFAADPMLIARRPIGEIDRLGTDKDNYSLVNINPSSDSSAIAPNRVPIGAVIDCPIYHEIMGLFNDVVDFERTTEVLVAPVHGAVGMNVFALSHFDESIRQDFPKITFVNETTVANAPTSQSSTQSNSGPNFGNGPTPG